MSTTTTTEAATEKRDAERYTCAIDLEAIGNGVPSGIGICVGDEKGRVVLKRKWWFKVDEKDVDPRCKEQFWDKNPLIYEEMLRDGKPIEDQLKDFVNVYDSIGEKLGIKDTELNLTSDNAEFDFGSLNEPLKKYLKRDPLRYTKKGEYRPITAYDDTFWALSERQKVISSYVNQIQVHNHSPDNDAEHNYISDMIHRRILRRLDKEHGELLDKLVKECSEEVINQVKEARKD